MAKRASILGAIALAALTSAVPASAIISYHFSGPIGDLTYFTPNFINTNIVRTPDQLVRCSSPIFGSCGDIGFVSDISVYGSTDFADTIEFGYPGGSGTSFFYYNDGAFQTPGVYADIFGGTNSLTVTQIATPAKVFYDFGGGIGFFSYISRDFVSSNRRIAPNKLHSCGSILGACGSIELFADSTNIAGSDVFDAIGFGYPEDGGASYFYFANYAFQVPGVYDDVYGGGNHRLVVTAATVPEPASWALLITGFAMVGTKLRRRRPLLA